MKSITDALNEEKHSLIAKTPSDRASTREGPSRCPMLERKESGVITPGRLACML